MVTEKNIDAIVRTFYDEWAHPKSYTGGDVDETSGKYEDRLNVGRITRLYAQEAHVDWDGVYVGTTPDGLDVAVRARLPFIANGYAFTAQDREDGTTAVDITGWITQDASRPFQDRGAYVPQQGEAPFAERLIVSKDGLVGEDLFRSGVTRIEEPANAISFAPLQQETPTPDTNSDLGKPLSDAEAHPEVDKFLRELYATGAGYVRSGGFYYAYRQSSARASFSAFFVEGPAFFWGRAPYGNNFDGGVDSPVSYVLVDWKILEERKGRLTVQTRIQSFASVTSTAAYFQDTFTLFRDESASSCRVGDQQREQIPAFRAF